MHRFTKESKKWAKLLPLVLLMAGGAFLQGCSSLGGFQQAGSNVERWNMEEADTPEAARPSDAGASNPQARNVCAGQEQRTVVEEGLAQPVTAVFYRDPPPATTQGNPLNVYINGHYQASLVGNTFTMQKLRPGEHRLMVAFNDVERRYISKDGGQVFRVGQEPMQYFAITADEGAVAEASIAAVGMAQGKAAVQGRTRQNHTVPRVVRRKCAP